MAYENSDPYEDGNAPAPAQPKPDPDRSETDEGEATALLPKSFFQGKELAPGNRCEVEITQVHGEEVSVKYLAHEENEEQPDEPPAPASPTQGDQEMSSMLE